MAHKLGRRNRLIQEERHDAYQQKKKWQEPTVCSECNAVFLEGRWAWWEPAINARRIVCPACQRIKDKDPAGRLEIRGSYFVHHQDEVLNLIRNTESKEKDAHPMERIMGITSEEDHSLLTTTGIHIARRIGDALQDAYQGELNFTYGDAEKSIHMVWSREHKNSGHDKTR